MRLRKLSLGSRLRIANHRLGRPARGLWALGFAGLFALAWSQGDRANDPMSQWPAPRSDRVESSRADRGPRVLMLSTAKPPSTSPETASLAEIARAKSIVATARRRFALVKDYACLLEKRERIQGRAVPRFRAIYRMRNRPLSIYLKFLEPKPGREAIYVAGKNQGKALVHDVGLGKLLAGTLHLDPLGAMAMEDCRHPITEAGIGHLIEMIAERWAIELRPEECRLRFQNDVRLDERECLAIESIHTKRMSGDFFERVRVTFDDALELPIRFEAYEWPSNPGGDPVLVEDYIYHDLKLNVGLGDLDFDPNNRAYSFGRF